MQEFTKVTSDDKKDKGVSGLPDVPSMTANELKERFDSLANLAIDAINTLATELGLDSAASKIGTASGSLQSWMSSCESNVSQNKMNIESIEDRVINLELSSGTGEGENSQSFVDLKNTVKENSKSISDTKTDIENMVLLFSDITVLSSSWKSNIIYEDYPYVAELSLDGIEDSYVPYVIFGLEDAQSGTFAPVAQSAKNIIRIFANEQISKDITIPTIQCIRKA